MSGREVAEVEKERREILGRYIETFRLGFLVWFLLRESHSEAMFLA